MLDDVTVYNLRGKVEMLDTNFEELFSSIVLVEPLKYSDLKKDTEIVIFPMFCKT